MAGETLSLRAYGRRRQAAGLPGHTHVAVLHAIQRGRLSASVVRSAAGRVIGVRPDLADREWTGNTDAAQQRAQPAGGRPAQQAEFFEPQSAAAGPPPTGNGGMTYQRARTVREYFQAKGAELDWRKRSGQVVEADDVRIEASRLGREVRDAVLNCAHNIAPELANRDARTISVRLVQALSAALGALGSTKEA